MRIFRTTALALSFCCATVVSPLFFTCTLGAQETTGSLQGTVKDPSGAVVANATVSASTPTLVGVKTTTTDGHGYYHFQNLPPGPYVIRVKASGFDELKQTGLDIEVGHSPSVDLSLKIGSESTVVDVSAESPQIDVTSVTTETNVTGDVLADVPHGTSFQSVIEFAPSARNEPLMGGGNGKGSCSPGSCASGNAVGFSIAGASDSENSYLVEGQETADIIGGYSHTNVPLDFADQVEITTSGIQAEHGGALGGVVNVIMQKGTSHLHGGIFMDFQSDKLNAGPNASLGYDPTTIPTTTSWGLADAAPRFYLNEKPHYSDVFPGFKLGGPLAGFLPRLLNLPASMNDRAFLFFAFKPDMNRDEVFVNYGTGTGVIPFSQNTNTYYGTARLDVKVTDKIRVFGSWLDQFQKEYGENIPSSDSLTGQLNTATSSSPTNYAHTLGYSAPNTTLNTGADITLTPNLVSTTRFGYFFENYHDFGYPVGGVVTEFEDSGCSVQNNSDGTCPAGQANTDAFGSALPASLQLGQFAQSGALANTTAYNSSKSIHLDQDISWYHSGWFGNHNIKGGYQLNRNSNYISQIFNEPYVQVYVGGSANYQPAGPVGAANCAQIEATDNIPANSNNKNNAPNCEGQYGYVTLYDYGTGGKATSYNNGFYVQDSWQIRKRVTIDAGVRLEHESVPGEGLGGNAPANPIKFGWGDKIAPRLGAAWDVFGNGKAKVFGSFGDFFDQMKLNVAISSFGGQYWQNCTYALDTPNLSSINVAYDANNRYCSGDNAASQGNFATGAAPAGLTFLENYNLRAFPTTCSTCSAAQEGVVPGLKPYKQHESVFGADYQLARNLAFEARWDRRRLDNVIEDSAIFNPLVGETFVIVNPGQGTNATFEGFCNFLYGPGPGGTTNPGCVSSSNQYPPNQTIPAARSYDGVELRLSKSLSNHWFGLVSYTYSHLRGNYTGLTTSDQSDGIGRNAPNNSRAFDEPYFSYNSMGGSSSGLLPTDRPNAFKGDGYYRFNYLHKWSTDLGLFQTLYSGSPKTTYMNIGYGGGFPVQIFNRGIWSHISQDPSTGLISVGTPHVERNPWYIQSDFNLNQAYQVKEGQQLTLGATFTNLFNEHAVTSVYEQVDSSFYGNQYGTPGGNPIFNGAAFYAAAESPYDVTNLLNSNNSQGGPITVNSQYGKPIQWQAPRSIRLSVKYNF